jgi:hypothetical protein
MPQKFMTIAPINKIFGWLFHLMSDNVFFTFIAQNLFIYQNPNGLKK